MKFKIQFDSGDLYYQLHESPLAQKWWYEFSNRTIKNLGAWNQNLKIKNEQSFIKKYKLVCDRLETLIEYLKEVGYNINGKLDKNDMQESLNRLHEHFPINVLHQNNFKIKQALNEYNVIIHWLEASLNFHKQTDLKVSHLHLYFDNEKRYDLLDNDYNFTTNIKNGDILCAYPGPGRHFTEIVISKDYDLPLSQIVLHSRWSANCNIMFFNKPEIMEFHRKKFVEEANIVYNEMGGKDTFGYNFQDKKLGLGWLPLASLVSDPTIFDNATEIIGWKKC